MRLRKSAVWSWKTERQSRNWSIVCSVMHGVQKSILETLKQPNAICLIAVKSRPHGGISFLAYTAAEEMEIARIGVVKEMRRQGVARELLGALEKIGKQSGLKNIVGCAVRKRSGTQIIYKRRIYGRRDQKAFYSDPDEDAVLMSKTVK